MTLSVADGEAILRANFAPWVQELGLRIESLEGDGARLRLPFDERLTRSGGTLCGQALMAFADTAMVFAVTAASGGFRPMTTVGQTISFMKPVMGEDVIAEVRVLRLGRTLAFGEVRLLGANSAILVAHATTTYAILGPAEA